MCKLQSVRDGLTTTKSSLIHTASFGDLAFFMAFLLREVVFNPNIPLPLAV